MRIKCVFARCMNGVCVCVVLIYNEIIAAADQQDATNTSHSYPAVR